MLKETGKFKHITLISIFISGILLIFSIGSLLLSLPFIFNISELSPIYLLIRSANFGTFLQNPEAIFILIWILAFMSFLSVFTMLITYIVRKSTKHYNPYIYSLIIIAILFILAMVPKNLATLNILESSIYKYFSILLIFVYSFIILLVGFLKCKTPMPKEDD